MTSGSNQTAWPNGTGLDDSSWAWELFIRTAGTDHKDLQAKFAPISAHALKPPASADLTNPLTRFRRLQSSLELQLVRRRPAIRALLAGAIALEPVLLVGPPGTAKGALAQLFSEGIGAHQLPDRPGTLQLPERKGYFEIQLTATTDVDEVMGGIDLDAFKRSTIRRRTDRMMVHSVVVFIDEVFRGSGAVLNSLLLLLNERMYADGGNTYPADALVLVGATNGVASREELAAFYSRFPLRAYCPPVTWAAKDSAVRASRGGQQVRSGGSGAVNPEVVEVLLELLRKGTVLEESRCSRMLAIPPKRPWITPTDAKQPVIGLQRPQTSCMLDLLTLHRYVRMITNAWVDPSWPGAEKLPMPRWRPEDLVSIYATMTKQPGLASGAVTGLKGQYLANDRALARLARILVADNLLQGTLGPPGTSSRAPLDPDQLFLLTCTSEQPPNPERDPDVRDFTGDLEIVFSALGL